VATKGKRADKDATPPSGKGAAAPSELQLADRMFAAGDRTEAVKKYKSLFASAKSDKQTEILRRIVEFELAEGDRKEARRWVETGLNRGLAPAYSTPGATDLLAQVQAERDQQAAAAKKEREAEEVRKRDERIKTIVADLRSGTPKTRRAAIKAAGGLGEHGKPATPQLVATLADRDDRAAAFDALVRIGKPAVPDLIKGLGNKNQFVRIWCAHALGRIGSDASDAAPALMERARSDASINVRDAAKAALAKVRG
jgi:HEAT repeat protein